MRLHATPALCALAIAFAMQDAHAAATLDFVKDAAALRGATVVDARAQSACLQRSIRGAHCLPAADFLGPHGRLASFRQIAWLLGTAGLSGDEHVLVAGDDPVERDFVAGMLYLCGQRKVSILTVPISSGAGLAADRMGPGEPRGMTQRPIYGGTVRGDEIVLRTELAAALASARPPHPLDGRTEAEFWGERIRAWRGGHLPEAQSLPMERAQGEIAQGRLELPQGQDLVAYGHDAFESVAYFAMLRAATPATLRVLVDGWADWANHPELPVDSLTYPDRRDERAAPVRASPSRWTIALALSNALALLALAGVVLLSRRRAA